MGVGSAPLFSGISLLRVSSPLRGAMSPSDRRERAGRVMPRTTGNVPTMAHASSWSLSQAEPVFFALPIVPELGGTML